MMKTEKSTDIRSDAVYFLIGYGAVGVILRYPRYLRSAILRLRYLGTIMTGIWSI